MRDTFRSVAVPASVGPPVPYWPSVIVKPETIRGIGTYYVNLILDIIFGAFALIVGLSAVFVATASDPITAIGITAALGAASCGLIIVFIINFIMSLMSVVRMHHGADEYGPEHSANAQRGVLFKWIGTSLSTMAAILVVYLLIAGSTAFVFGGSVPTIVYVPLLITAFWTSGVSAKAQMYRFFVRSLQPPETRRWSDLASALIPALGIIGLVVVGYFTVRIVDLISHPGPVTAQEASRLSGLMIGGVFLPPGFALVGYLIFLIVYGRTRQRLSEGLNRLYGTAFGSIPVPGAWNPFTAVPPPGATTPVSSPALQGSGGGFCGQCGHPLPASALFCVNCGARTGVSPPVPP